MQEINHYQIWDSRGWLLHLDGQLVSALGEAVYTLYHCTPILHLSPCSFRICLEVLAIKAYS